VKFYLNEDQRFGRKRDWQSDSTREATSTLQPLQADSLQISTDLNALMEVLDWFDQFNHPPVPFQIWLQCQLALAEGFTNAVRHAHQGRSHLAIELEVAMFTTYLEIRIWDSGAPFDLYQALQQMPHPSDPAAEGGRGLKLIQRIADRLSYTRTADSRNCLHIVKQYPDANAAPRLVSSVDLGS
jgi:serine/threonine-protein kinase RsbW